MRNRIAKKFILFTIILAAFFIAAGLSYRYYFSNRIGETPQGPKYVPNIPDKVQTQYVLLNIPFTAQAPQGHWEDPRQEDACEEASILMSWLWINDLQISPQEAEKAITDMADFEQYRYGNYQDFDAEDTAKLMTDYYGYKKLSVKINPSIEDIKNQLRLGNVVLVPTNGQALGNPHYKQPGPLTHMLVIKGFDDATGKFTTNDPGTRFGESYLYDYQTVFNAMVNYPSGHHESQAGRPKAMIAIEK